MPRIPSRLPWWRVVLILVLTVALGWIVSQEIIKPIQKVIANRYVSKGNSYFISLDYSDAVMEYANALHYEPGLPEAVQNSAMATKAPTDPASALPFFKDHNMVENLELLDQSRQTFGDPKAALTEGVKLYTDQQYSYAQYPLQTAVTLDPQYPEAWHYLMLTYQGLAKIDPSYAAKAADAQKHQNALTSKYITL